LRRGPVNLELLARRGASTIGKIIECAKVDPSSGCTHVVRGKTEEEVLKNAMEHAKQDGIREVTPELMAKVKGAHIRSPFSREHPALKSGC